MYVNTYEQISYITHVRHPETRQVSGLVSPKGERGNPSLQKVVNRLTFVYCIHIQRHQLLWYSHVICVTLQSRMTGRDHSQSFVAAKRKKERCLYVKRSRWMCTSGIYCTSIRCISIKDICIILCKLYYVFIYLSVQVEVSQGHKSFGAVKRYKRRAHICISKLTKKVVCYILFYQFAFCVCTYIHLTSSVFCATQCTIPFQAAVFHSPPTFSSVSPHFPFSFTHSHTFFSRATSFLSFCLLRPQCWHKSTVLLLLLGSTILLPPVLSPATLLLTRSTLRPAPSWSRWRIMKLLEFTATR